MDGCAGPGRRGRRPGALRSPLVELYAEEGEPLADRCAHRCRALADAGGEDERVQAAERRGHGGDGGGDAVHEDVEREPAGLACVEDIAEVAARARERREPGLEVQRVVELVEGRAAT